MTLSLTHGVQPALKGRETIRFLLHCAAQALAPRARRILHNASPFKGEAGWEMGYPSESDPRQDQFPA
jgi:hypothetical protein